MEGEVSPSPHYGHGMWFSKVMGQQVCSEVWVQKARPQKPLLVTGPHWRLHMGNLVQDGTLDHTVRSQPWCLKPVGGKLYVEKPADIFELLGVWGQLRSLLGHSGFVSRKRFQLVLWLHWAFSFFLKLRDNNCTYLWGAVWCFGACIHCVIIKSGELAYSSPQTHVISFWWKHLKTSLLATWKCAMHDC